MRFAPFRFNFVVMTSAVVSLLSRITHEHTLFWSICDVESCACPFPLHAQEYLFVALAYTHPTVMSLFMAGVSMAMAGAIGGFANRKAPLQLLLMVGCLRCV